MNLKNILIGVAILILTISVAVYGVNVFYKSPEYNDFCSNGYPREKFINDSEICPAVCVPMWEIEQVQCIKAPCNPVCNYVECGSGCGADGVKTFEKKEQCEIVLSGKQCYNVYDDALKVYQKNVFLIALPLGVAVIALGALVFGLEVVGVGLMAGGVGIILWGVGGFWRFAEDWLKFALSFAGLVILIWLAYYIDRKFRKGKKR